MTETTPTDSIFQQGGIPIKDDTMSPPAYSPGLGVPSTTTKDLDLEDPFTQHELPLTGGIDLDPALTPLSMPPDEAATSTPSAELTGIIEDKAAVIAAFGPNDDVTQVVDKWGAEEASKITFEEWLALSELNFEWGDSYDDKDWERLAKIVAPTLMVDYTEVKAGHYFAAMPAAEYLGHMSSPGFLGDPLVSTQHHIGASKFVKIDDDYVIGHHQIRAAHQRYTDETRTTVEAKGHGHATIMHHYRRFDGVWKFAGLRPRVRWNEFEFEKIFVHL